MEIVREQEKLNRKAEQSNKAMQTRIALISLLVEVLCIIGRSILVYLIKNEIQYC